jgi:predicted transcriptional regulator
VISFQVERSTTEQLAELARREDRTLSAEIRRAVREHLEKDSPGDTPPPRWPAGSTG